MTNFNDDKNQMQYIEDSIAGIKETEIELINKKIEIEYQLKRIRHILGKESCQKTNKDSNFAIDKIISHAIDFFLFPLKLVANILELKRFYSRLTIAFLMAFISIKAFFVLLKYFDPFTSLMISACFILLTAIFYLIVS